MKQFFEQYGGVALGILALLVLIAMITPVGNIIKTSLQGTVQTFGTKMDGQVDTMTESMNAAFTNAAGFTGIKDNHFYYDGKIKEELKDVVFSSDKAVYSNGTEAVGIIFDCNLILDGRMLSTGIEGFKFDIWIDGIKLRSAVTDAWEKILGLENKHYVIEVVECPSNIEIENPRIEFDTNYMINNARLTHWNEKEWFEDRNIGDFIGHTKS